MTIADFQTIGPCVPPLHWPDNDVELSYEFPVSLDNVEFSRKPTHGEFGGVSNRIGSLHRLMTIAELAFAVTRPYGKTWSAGIFDLSLTDGKRNANAWCLQQFFAIDCDGKVPFAWQDALNRCREYGVMPCFIYTTFSAEEEERYRMVFVVSCMVSDENVRNTINRLLLELFPECDQSTKDAARLVTGGRKLLHLDENAWLDVEKLVRGFHLFWLDRDPANYARKVKTVGKDLKINVRDGNVLDIHFHHPEEIDDAGDVPASPAIEMNRDGLNVMNWRWDYNNILLSHHRFIRFGQVSFVFKSTGKPTDIVLSRQAECNRSHSKKKFPATGGWRQRRLNNPNWKRLYDNCPVSRSFANHERWFTNDELFAILTNLRLMKGGSAKFRAFIESSPYDYNMPKIEAMVTYVRKAEYNPATYESAFPEVRTSFPTMYHAGLSEYGKVVTTNQNPPRSLCDVNAEFAGRLEKVVASSEPGIYVLKAPTGFGKSQYLLRWNGGITVALPRHDLIRSIGERYQQRGIQPIMLPEFPVGTIPADYEAEVERLWTTGCFAQAQEFLRAIDQMGWSKDLTSYLEGKAKMKSIGQEELVLTTNVSAINAGAVHDTIIFDEDPLEILLPTRSILESDIATFRSNLVDWIKSNTHESDKLIEVVRDTIRWCDDLIALPVDDGTHMIQPVHVPARYLRFLLEKIIARADIHSGMALAIDARVACVTVFDGVRTIHTVGRRKLPEDKKIIILSATADEWVYRRLFGDRLQMFYDTGLVESRGRLIQYHSRSFSRTALAQCDSLGQFLDQEYDRASRITFKGQRDALQADMHFGATSGMNTLTGEDLVVIGTPHRHPVTYRLLAAVLGMPVRAEQLAMVNQQVERNGLKFWFFTYRNPVLRNIHLHLVESELVQAIGRARHLRHTVTVTVFSNYPVLGAEYRELPTEWWERMTARKEDDVPACESGSERVTTEPEVTFSS